MPTMRICGDCRWWKLPSRMCSTGQKENGAPRAVRWPRSAHRLSFHVAVERGQAQKKAARVVRRGRITSRGDTRIGFKKGFGYCEFGTLARLLHPLIAVLMGGKRISKIST